MRGRSSHELNRASEINIGTLNGVGGRPHSNAIQAILRTTKRLDPPGFRRDPARADQLFRPFSRLHARDDFAGSGIGLSIVQRVVERHGGTVQASAVPGRGACLEFTLPALPVTTQTNATEPAPAAAETQATALI